MNDVAQSRFASILTILLGIWLIISPIWISIAGGALTSLIIVGAVMVVMGLSQLSTDNVLPSWIMALAAIWLFISAYVFSVNSAVMWNEILSSIAAIILAVWDGVEVAQIHQRHHAS